MVNDVSGLRDPQWTSCSKRGRGVHRACWAHRKRCSDIQYNDVVNDVPGLFTTAKELVSRGHPEVMYRPRHRV